MASNSGVFERSEKEQKLDRQLRLWGGHGQAKLEQARVLCAGAGATASEIIKNLVLPNVGGFTLLDDATVGVEDGNSFFIDQGTLGQPRATAVTKSLLELNPDCLGVAEHGSAEDYIVEGKLSYFEQFTLVIITVQLTEPSLMSLSAHLFAKDIPLLLVQTNGLLGYARLQLREQLIVENKADNDRSDIMVHPAQIAKFPELQAFVNGFDISALEQDTKLHAHIPYLVIISKAVQAYQEEHKGALPVTWSEKKAFKNAIKAMRLSTSEENFDEALIEAHRAYKFPTLYPDTADVYADACATNLTKDSDLFWVCVWAVNEFKAQEGRIMRPAVERESGADTATAVVVVEGEALPVGVLPVSTNVPDMVAETKDYVALKEIFKARAAKDSDIVLDKVQKKLVALGIELEPSTVAMYVAHFVKHARWVQVVRTSSIAGEYGTGKGSTNSDKGSSASSTGGFDLTAVEEVFTDADEDYELKDSDKPIDLHWYFAFRAASRFYTAHGRVAGAADEEIESDAVELIRIQKELFVEVGLDRPVDERCLYEITRYGGCEPHNTAAMVGGIASQVALKVILQQFTPLNNTIVINGVHGSTATLRV